MNHSAKRKSQTKKTIAIIMIVIITGYLLWNDETPAIEQSKIPESAIIEYPSEFNFRQTINDCGPFNTAAVVRSLTGKRIDSKDFAESMQWRLRNKYTLPWGMEAQLEEKGISIETPKVESLSDEDKIAFLQAQLSLHKPIIILGERDNYEHYITLLGFSQSQSEFYMYDSLLDKGEGEGLTIDKNGSLPGNSNISFDELIKFWSGGGMYGLYKWYVIIASGERGNISDPW